MSLDSYYSKPTIGALRDGERYGIPFDGIGQIANPANLSIGIPDNSFYISKLRSDTMLSTKIDLNVEDGRGDCYIAAGKVDPDDTTNGFWLGIDESDNKTPKFVLGGDTDSITMEDGNITITGEITATSGSIGGWDIGETTIYSGASDIVLDSENKSIYINDSIFGNQGIQLEYNSGTPRVYFGDGSDQYFNFDGDNITWKSLNSELNSSGNLIATTVTISGSISTEEGSDIDGSYIDSISAGQIVTDTLSSISSDLGIITAASITVGSSGYVRGGMTDFLTGDGFFLGYSGGAYKFSVGSETGDSMSWDDDNLRIIGNLSVSSPFLNASYTVANLPTPPSNTGDVSPTDNETINQTSIFYPDSDPEATSVDGYGGVIGSELNWSNVRGNSANTVSSSYSFGNVSLKRYETTGWWYLYRFIALFDTSDIPDNATIDSANLGLYVYSKTDSYIQGVGVVSSNPASNTNLVVSDFDLANFGSTRYATDINIADMTTYAYNTWTFNGTGIAAISKTGVTKLGVRLGADIDDSEPNRSLGAFSGVTFYTADSSSNKPKLSVTYSADFTNPGNVYADDSNYATADSNTGEIDITLSGDGGSSYGYQASYTYNASETNVTFGGPNNLWGATWDGTKMNDTNFRMKINCGGYIMILKDFGFSFSGTVTGIEIKVKAKYNSPTISINHVTVKVYYGDSVVEIESGSQSYVSDGGAGGNGGLAIYGSSSWIQLGTVPGGGTGATTLTGILKGNGTSAITGSATFDDLGSGTTGKDRTAQVPLTFYNGNQSFYAGGFYGLDGTELVGGTIRMPDDFLSGTTVKFYAMWSATSTNNSTIDIRIKSMANSAVSSWNISDTEVEFDPDSTDDEMITEIYSSTDSDFVAGRAVTLELQANSDDEVRLRGIAMVYKAKY